MSRTGAFIRGANSGMGRLAQSLAMGGQTEDQAFMSSTTGQSKIMQALAAAQKDRADADSSDVKTSVIAGRPDLYDEQAALHAGVDVPTVRAYRESIRTGKMPQVEMQGPATPEGGALMADKVPAEVRGKIATALQRLAPFVSDSGDIGMKGLADAMGAYQTQDRAAAVRGGGLDLATVGQQEAALSGKPLVTADEFGSTNLFTGRQDASGPAAVRFGAYRDASTGAQKANAAQSYAAAGASKASADKSRAEMADGTNRTGGKAPTGYRWGADGQTLEAIPGGPADPNTKGAKLSKPPTEGQAKALMFGARMAVADEVLGELADKKVMRPGAIKGGAEAVGNLLGFGTDAMGGALADIAGTATNWTQSEGQQQVEQAQRDFINAVLRRESGAAIGQGEFRNAAKQYFPQPNDSKETLRQKAANRRTAIAGMKAEFGEAMAPEFDRIVSEGRATRRGAKGGRPLSTGSWDATPATAAPGSAPRSITVDW